MNTKIKKRKKDVSKLIAVICLASLFVLVDLYFKHTHQYTLNGGYAFGINFSFLNNLIITLLVYIFLIVLVIKARSFSEKLIIAVLMVLGLSNSYDRLVIGAVRDYIVVGPLIVNLSDILISLVLINIMIFTLVQKVRNGRA